MLATYFDGFHFLFLEPWRSDIYQRHKNVSVLCMAKIYCRQVQHKPDIKQGHNQSLSRVRMNKPTVYLYGAFRYFSKSGCLAGRPGLAFGVLVLFSAFQTGFCEAQGLSFASPLWLNTPAKKDYNTAKCWTYRGCSMSDAGNVCLDGQLVACIVLFKEFHRRPNFKKLFKGPGVGSKASTRYTHIHVPVRLI